MLKLNELSLPRARIGFALSITAAFAAGYALSSARAATGVHFEPLVASSETILGESFAYPSGKPKITTGILSLEPGAETGWHTHGAPPTGIILDGELTVDYGEKGKRTYRKGDSLIETMATAHNGKNTGEGVMRLFVVFVGAEGITNTTPLKK
ncbi:MAG: cupin domain-containing protein [Hyphomicrobiaceae bacterium]